MEFLFTAGRCGSYCNTYRICKGLGLTIEEVYGLIEDRVLEIDEKGCSIDEIRDPDRMVRVKTESVGKFMRILFMRWKNEPVRKSKVERKIEGMNSELHELTSEVRSLTTEVKRLIQAG